VFFDRLTLQAAVGVRVAYAWGEQEGGVIALSNASAAVVTTRGLRVSFEPALLIGWSF
jgi:hypothetical protein